MYKIIAFIGILSYTMLSRAQINLIKTETNNFYFSYGKVSFSYLGDKLCRFNNIYGENRCDTIIIYNQDLSIYQQLNIPDITNIPYSEFNVFKNLRGESLVWLSDGLFNNDSLIEFSIRSYNPDRNTYTYKIMNQREVLFTVEQSYYTWLPKIYSLNDSYYMSMQMDENTVNYYSLPGSFPCNNCSALTGLAQDKVSDNSIELNAFPNPFFNTVQVNYHIPGNSANPKLLLSDISGKALISINLLKQSGDISINTADIPKGNIIISLYGDNSLISRKFIKL